MKKHQFPRKLWDCPAESAFFAKNYATTGNRELAEQCAIIRAKEFNTEIDAERRTIMAMVQRALRIGVVKSEKFMETNKLRKPDTLPAALKRISHPKPGVLVHRMLG